MEFRDLKAQYKKLKPQMDEAISKAVVEGRYILGPQVTELEDQLAEYVGVSHCITCANGTDALQLALMAYEIGEGDCVFVPDLTFFASAEAVATVRATPVFVDIENDGFNIDIDSLEDAIKRVLNEGKLKPRAVMAVDLFGLPANYPQIKKICKEYDLLLIEDGAQGFGGAIEGKLACSFADIATTSFFPAKPLGCYGDGGAIFTNDEKIDKLLRSYKFHGKGEDKYDNVRIGMNSRLDTVQAAILQVKLKAFYEYELSDVNAVADMYTKRLKDVVNVPKIPQGFYSSWAQYCILLKDEEQRDGLQKYLNENKIPTMIYFPKPMHSQQAFAYLEDDGKHCKRATDVSKRVLALPMGPYVTKEDLNYVCDTVIKYLG